MSIASRSPRQWPSPNRAFCKVLQNLRIDTIAVYNYKTHGYELGYDADIAEYTLNIYNILVKWYCSLYKGLAGEHYTEDS